MNDFTNFDTQYFIKIVSSVKPISSSEKTYIVGNSKAFQKLKEFYPDIEDCAELFLNEAEPDDRVWIV